VSGTTLLVVVVATALAFEFTNGFHDTANAVATSASTRALSPRVAVLVAAVMNLVGGLVSTRVAVAIGTDIVEPEAVTLHVILAAVIAAAVWNLLTWRMGLPSSSTHALIGGLVGATIAAAGSEAVQWGLIARRVLAPALLAPLIGFAVAFALMLAVYRAFARSRPARVNRGFRLAQIGSGSFTAFAHGANDAQKTMGVIALALYADGRTGSPERIPTWVVVLCATVMAAGTYAGGWRIMRTIGQRVFKLEPTHGFAAETGTAGVLIGTAALGLPVSTTHVISGAVVGVGSTRHRSAVRWGMARDIVIAWGLTLPAAALLAAGVVTVLDRA
jgi:PiT family inorganic phosphate transporter